MARKSETYKKIGVRPGGKTPPELMPEKEMYAFMYSENLIMAKALGGKPREHPDYFKNAAP